MTKGAFGHSKPRSEAIPSDREMTPEEARQFVARSLQGNDLRPTEAIRKAYREFKGIAILPDPDRDPDPPARPGIIPFVPREDEEELAA